jgi:hypothetical protein
MVKELTYWLVPPMGGTGHSSLVPFRALIGSLRVYSTIPLLVVLDDNVAYQILFLTGVRSAVCQLIFMFQKVDNLQVSQCLTNNAVYSLPEDIGVSSSAELYKVPFGAADPLNTMAVVPFPNPTSLTPLIDPGTDPAEIGLVMLAFQFKSKN